MNAGQGKTNNKKPWLRRIAIGLFVILAAGLSAWVIFQLATTGFSQTKTKILASKPIIIFIAIAVIIGIIISWSVKIDKAIGVFKKYLFKPKDLPANSPNDDRKEQRKDQLLQAVIDGKLSVKDAKEMAETFIEEAYPTGIESTVDNGKSSEDFKNAVVDIARSGNNERRQALALLADETTRSEGFNQLRAIAQSASNDLAQQWRELAELAYPFDTQKSLAAYEQVIKYSPADIWAHIYLSRLYVRNNNLPAAKSTVAKPLNSTLSKRDKSVIFNELGDIATAQTDLPAARTYYEDGLEIFKTLTQSDPTNGEYQRDLSVSYNKLGDIATAQTDLPAARTYYQDGLKIRKALTQSDPTNGEYQRDLSVSYDKLGDITSAQTDLPAARTYYEDGLEIFKTLTQSDPTNGEYQRDLSVSYNKLGDIATAQTDLPAARAYYEDGLEIAKTLAQSDPTNGEYQRDLSVSYNKLGDIATAQTDLPAARAYYQDGLEIRKTLTQSDPTNGEYQRDLSVSYNKLGDIATAQTDLPAARTYYEDGLEIFKTLTQSDPTNGEYQRDLSVSYNKLGDIATAQTDLPAALAYYQDALKIRKALTQSDPTNGGYQRDLAFAHARLAMLGGDDTKKHWKLTHSTLKSLNDAGRLAPTDKGALKHAASMIEAS